MPKINQAIYLFLLILFINLNSYGQDWPNLGRFQEENIKLIAEKPMEKGRVVFMGNSITEGWQYLSPDFFKDKPYINRGISGQTTPQMLLRFRQDVIMLNPEAVIILAGTNDIAGNTGPATNEMITNNLISMVQLAKANNIKVILCSILPTNSYPWSPDIKPAQRIVDINNFMIQYCNTNNINYLDFYSHLVDDKLGLKKEYSEDGVHPNAECYKIMNKVADDALNTVLKHK